MKNNQSIMNKTCDKNLYIRLQCRTILILPFKKKETEITQNKDKDKIWVIRYDQKKLPDYGLYIEETTYYLSKRGYFCYRIIYIRNWSIRTFPLKMDSYI